MTTIFLGNYPGDKFQHIGINNFSCFELDFKAQEINLKLEKMQFCRSQILSAQLWK